MPVALQGLATVAGLVCGGKLRLIGVGTPAPLPQFPDAPTIATSGLPGFQFSSWCTVMAPAGTPKAAIERMQAAIAEALDSKEVQDSLAAQGCEVFRNNSSEFAKLVSAELPQWQKIVKDSGAKLD